MSLKFSINGGRFKPERLCLPSRYMYYPDEGYMKLLTVGEGLFSGDRVSYGMSLTNSSLIVASESACKVYPAEKGGYAKLTQKITLEHSNFEYINDELLLFKNAAFAGSVRIEADEESTFFYADMVTKGRSFENFDFSRFFNSLRIRLSSKTEYAERYDISGETAKGVFSLYGIKRPAFARIIIKPSDMGFAVTLRENGIEEYEFSAGKRLIIVTFISSGEHEQKQAIKKIWSLYRTHLGRKEFDLGKY